MINDRIDDIIDMLIESTENGSLLWLENKNLIQNSSYNNVKSLLVSSEDGETSFEITIKYTLSNSNWVLETSFGITIRNIELPSGQLYVNSHSNPKIFDLRKVLLDTYCSDLNPSIDMVETKLSDIFKNISISTFRDKVVNKILDK